MPVIQYENWPVAIMLPIDFLGSLKISVSGLKISVLVDAFKHLQVPSLINWIVLISGKHCK